MRVYQETQKQIEERLLRMEIPSPVKFVILVAPESVS